MPFSLLTFFFKIFQEQHVRVSNSLVDRQRSVNPDLGPNCLQRKPAVADPEGVQGVRWNPLPAPVFIYPMKMK